MGDSKKIGCNPSDQEQEDPSERINEENADLNFKESRRRDLIMFFLSVLILILIGFAGILAYNKFLKPVEKEYRVVINPDAGD
jgi:hypothetical protein